MAAKIEICPVEDKKQLGRFIKLPWTIYRADKYWVPPLIGEQKKLFTPEQNPFYRHAEVALFLAEKAGQTVGRIAAIVNRAHNEFYGDKIGFFGFFESTDDQDISDKLFEAAGKWLREKGMDCMRGPMNFSTNEECGLLVEGFDSSPMIMMTYNPPYYIHLVERNGFYEAKDLLAFWLNTSQPIPERILRIAEKVSREHKIHLRTLDVKRFDEEMEKVKLIYNQAWSRNWGFVPMSDEEFYHMAINLKRIAVPELLFLAEIGGEPAAFSVAVPDFNQALNRINGKLDPISLMKLLWYSRKANQLRLMLLGVRAGYRRRGIDSLLYIESLKTAKKLGYIGGEVSWILEDNTLIIRGIEAMGGRVYKRYRIYDKRL